MRKIKIAQIGINQYSHSNEIWGSITKQKDLFEVVGYVLPENEEKRIPHKYEKLGNYNQLSLDDVLKNPEIEAVTIETDEIYLTKYALMAAKAGKHIHMEKPGGINLNDFEDLIGIIRKTGKVFHVGYMYRYNPFIHELIEKAKNGELGDIISVEAQMNCIHPKEHRQWLNELPDGMMFYLGCHLIDLVLQIQGEPKKVIPYNKCTGMDGVIAKDFGMALFEYDKGVSFVKTTDCEIGGFDRRQLVVTGTKGTIELKPLERYVAADLLCTVKTEHLSNDWYKAGEHSQSEPINRYDNMMKSFAEYVSGEKTNPYSLDYELELYKTILKCCGDF